MFGFFNFHGTLIQGLGITEKQLVKFLEKKGLRRIDDRDKTDNFSYESNKYLVYYNSLERSIQLMHRDNQNNKLIEFAKVYFRTNGVAELETEDNRHLNQFVIWLKSPEECEK